MNRLLLLGLLLGLATGASAQSVFINEIHYDDAGGDSGEGVEIAGPAGTDLTGYQIVPYNGSGGTSYSAATLSGSIPNQQNGYGTVFTGISGLQNGAPDGVALVDAGGTVIQFLSYEGSFAATNGPANGMTSTDIGVSESGGVEGQSLQLTGTGTTYTDFSWAPEMASTYDAVNTGQTFSGAPAAPTVQFSMASAAVGEGDGTYDITVTISSAPTGNTSVDVVLDGAASTGDASDIDGYTTQTVTFADGDATAQTVTITITDDATEEGSEGIEFDLANLSGDPAATIGSPSAFTLTITDNDTPVAMNVFINEVDADSPSIDDLEFVELYDGGVGSTALDGLTLVLVNGNGEVPYATFDLDGFTTDANGFFVVGNSGVPGVDLVFADGGLQNGDDAVALYVGDPADFPSTTPVTTTNLLDAIVYGTGSRDTDLLAALGLTVQHDDDVNGNDDTESLQRLNLPIATSGDSNSGLFYALAPTPDAVNASVLTVDVTDEVDGSVARGGEPTSREALGYRQLSVPVFRADTGSFNVNDLAAINLVQGVSAGDGETQQQYPLYPANIFTSYDGGTYSAPPTTGTVLNAAEGFFWYFYDNDINPGPDQPGDGNPHGGGTSVSYDLANPAFALSLTGIPVDDRILGGTYSRAFTSSDGIYLIGNPGAYDYRLGGITVDSGTLSDMFSVWDPLAGTFDVLTANFGDPWAGAALPVWNGAFAEVTGGSNPATFSFSSDFADPTERVDLIGVGASASAEGRISFTLTGKTASEATTLDRAAILRVLQTGTTGWDRHDASKIAGPAFPRALLAPVGTRDDEARRQSAMSLPSLLAEAVEIPFAFEATEAGSYTIEWALDAFPDEWNVEIVDLQTGVSVDPRARRSYTFTSDATEWSERFSVVVTPQSVVAAEPGASGALELSAPAPNPAQASTRATLRVGDAQQVVAAVYDALGREVVVLHDGMVAAGTVLALRVDTSALAPGVYVLRARGADQTETRRFTVAN